MTQQMTLICSFLFLFVHSKQATYMHLLAHFESIAAICVHCSHFPRYCEQAHVMSKYRNDRRVDELSRLTTFSFLQAITQTTGHFESFRKGSLTCLEVTIPSSRMFRVTGLTFSPGKGSLCAFSHKAAVLTNCH